MYRAFVTTKYNKNKSYRQIIILILALIFIRYKILNYNNNLKEWTLYPTQPHKIYV